MQSPLQSPSPLLFIAIFRVYRHFLSPFFKLIAVLSPNYRRFRILSPLYRRHQHPVGDKKSNENIFITNVFIN
ncbi:MAG: hypothetical protein II565_14040, partial [Fibrobacter sp.]|nr:hypothetical protein [Fibrobacter sp.]